MTEGLRECDTHAFDGVRAFGRGGCVAKTSGRGEGLSVRARVNVPGRGKLQDTDLKRCWAARLARDLVLIWPFVGNVSSRGRGCSGCEGQGAG